MGENDKTDLKKKESREMKEKKTQKEKEVEKARFSRLPPGKSTWKPLKGGKHEKNEKINVDLCKELIMR